MKRLVPGLLTLVLFACSPKTENLQLMQPAIKTPASLPDLGPAPELANETWLNVDSPLRLADLRGRVVLLEMWTFGCINCQHVMPSLKEWHSKYKNQGLVIIGNHYPEFSYESDLANLRAAIQQNGIEYAVAQDNDGATWKAYQNRYWPTLYLIDKQGHIRYVHVGEGRYQETEANIQALLAEAY
ncbi:MAG: redoxin domain-containing protein [Bacteroidota bacterium]